MFSLLLIDAVDKRAKRENGEQEVYEPALPLTLFFLSLVNLTQLILGKMDLRYRGERNEELRLADLRAFSLQQQVITIVRCVV
jgi:hypothetical protein